MKWQLLRSDLKMDIVSMPLTSVREKRGLKYGKSLNKARMHKVRKLQLYHLEDFLLCGLVIGFGLYHLEELILEIIVLNLD